MKIDFSKTKNLSKKQLQLVAALLLALILVFPVVKLSKNRSPFPNLKVSAFFSADYTVRQLQFKRNIFNPTLQLIEGHIIINDTFDKMTKKNVSNNLKAAALELYKTRNKPKYIVVYAYEKDVEIVPSNRIAEINFRLDANDNLTYNTRFFKEPKK